MVLSTFCWSQTNASFVSLCLHKLQYQPFEYVESYKFLPVILHNQSLLGYVHMPIAVQWLVLVGPHKKFFSKN